MTSAWLMKIISIKQRCFFSKLTQNVSLSSHTNNKEEICKGVWKSSRNFHLPLAFWHCDETKASDIETS